MLLISYRFNRDLHSAFRNRRWDKCWHLFFLSNSADAPRPLLIIFLVRQVFGLVTIFKGNGTTPAVVGFSRASYFCHLYLTKHTFSYRKTCKLQDKHNVCTLKLVFVLSVRECWRCTNLSRHESEGQLRSQVVMNHNNWLIEATQYHWLFVCRGLLSTSVQYTYRRMCIAYLRF